MAEMNWWRAAKPHEDICKGRVNETLFAANLGEAVAGKGPKEYRDAETFFAKTFLTRGLRELLVDILRTLQGEPGHNPVANLQTTFGGGKTHAELAIFHLLAHPEESMRVEGVRALVAEAEIKAPPKCAMAVLACSSLNPLGRTTDDGVTIRTLWGEMAYQLGGKRAYALVAKNDAKMVSPGEKLLAGVLKQVGPCVILFDETLHYVDKASSLKGAEGDLAKQTVAFLRELTVAVDTVPKSMLVVTLTASKMDQLSNQALDWLERMNKHVNRLASARTPIEGTEIHEIVRQRLFEGVDGDAAQETAARYHKMYTGMGGLASKVQSADYQALLERSYPFHPELVTVLYERWGSKPGFQLTRGTLRFLAIALQDLWAKRNDASPDILRPADLSLAESNLRAMVRDVAGDPQWESVIGSDVASAVSGQLAKAQVMDRERDDGQRWAEGLAGTILLYSMGGGENPCATREELRLACARPDVEDGFWTNALDKFRTKLFYFYFDDAKYQFRKEPNVLSLQQTYRTNLRDGGEVQAYSRKTIEEKALGIGAPGTGFNWVKFAPESNADVPDNEDLKLIVLDFDHVLEGEKPSESARQAMLDIVERRGQVMRQCRNTLVFCLADADAAHRAQEMACEYLSWRKIEKNPTDWDRIGGAQQALVKEQRDETQSAALKGLISAFTWAVVPTETASRKLDLMPLRLSGYGPGKVISTMVWERLTSESGARQPILATLTAETLLQRYALQAWPESETWVTTAQLWERFTRQVALPMLARQEVLLDTLQQGQRESLLAFGHLHDEASPRDQRDSYLGMYFEDKALPPNTPAIGERWLVMRPPMYRQIANQPAQVTPVEVAEAIKELANGNQAVKVATLYNYVKGRKHDNMDDPSFHTSLAVAIRESRAAYRADPQGADEKTVPRDAEAALNGYVVLPTTTSTPSPSGRVITVKGKLQSLNDLAPLFNKVLKLLHSQNPEEFSIAVDVVARYKDDPGAGFDAALQDGFDPKAFPGLVVRDSKRK